MIYFDDLQAALVIKNTQREKPFALKKNHAKSTF